MKQIDVQIMQQSYLLTCPDGQEERVQEAARRVDDAMTRIRDSGKVRSRDRVAVLAALNMAFDVLDRDAQQALMANVHSEMQSMDQEQASAPEVSEAAQAELQRQQMLAEQLLLRLDQALETDEKLL
ncbi:cell division protein ZapA [Comamonas sp. Y33R10-2]|uniref:cell division protein ZapA n=1 Tax=Comamonas sp. Y33R10-2 TaxID=2853257 RepID=UPI001C5CB43E|nr:cell division protein ZapA [Comamonas sp. Y33R10-2]QXZ10603.1 cell division protein ZapA [Comamonas sp. Y33R10-2]